MSIVQLSRFLSFFSCDSFDILSNLFRFVKNFFIFLFCLICFPFGPLQATACIGYHISKALSTVFFICFFSASGSFCSALLPPAVPPPRLRLAWFPAAFQGSVISDRCYLITRKWNCQCFFSFLFISDNSHNSVIIQPYRKETIKMEFVYNENQIALYSEKGKLMETLAKDLEQRDLKTAPPALTL